MDKQRVNPFYHRLHFTKFDYFKILLGAIFLLPFRFIISVSLVAIDNLMLKFALIYLNQWKHDKDEYFRQRMKLIKYPKALFKAAFFSMGFYQMKIIDESGENQNPNVHPIYVIAPHTTLFEMLTGTILGGPPIVVKKEVEKSWIINNIFKFTDAVFVDRNSISSRQNMMKEVQERLERNSVFICPEGTRSNGKVMAQFKPGAFKLGHPIQPCIPKFNYGSLDTITCTFDGPSEIKQFLLSLCCWSSGLHVIKLPICYPSEEEKHNPELFAERISRIITQRTNIPMSFYSYDDVQFFNYNIPRTPSCLKFMKLCYKINQEISESKLEDIKSNDTIATSSLKEKRKKITSQVIELSHKIIDDIFERIELNSNVKIQSKQDLVNYMNLEKFVSASTIINSSSMNELWKCLTKITDPSAVHIGILMHLNDSRQSIWNRIKNCYELLLKSESNQSSINLESFSILIWFTLGIDKITEPHKIDEPITFDFIKRNLNVLFKQAFEENLAMVL